MGHVASQEGSGVVVNKSRVASPESVKRVRAHSGCDSEMEGVWDGGGVEVSKRFVSCSPSLLKGGAVP